MPMTQNPADPRRDPDSPEYDPRLDPNAEEYDEEYADEQEEYQPDEEAKAHGGERQEQERRRREEEQRRREQGKGEQSKPSGRQDATLPGSTPETSSQMPKPGESSDKGKGPLKFDPNAPAVDTVAQAQGMQVEGGTVDIPPERQIHSSAVPPERDPDKAWMEYVTQAINGRYPRLRNGVDFAVGRKTIDDDVELFYGQEAGVDWGQIEQDARLLADANPPGGGPGLVPPPTTGQGESEVLAGRRQNRELPTNIAQSEWNPRSDRKVPSQAAPPVSSAPGQSSGSRSSEGQSNKQDASGQPAGGVNRTGPQGTRHGNVNMPPPPPKPPADPNFNPDGSRKRRP